MATSVTLRAVEDDDLPVFFEHQRDPQATALAAFHAREWTEFAAHWARIRGSASISMRTVVALGVVVGHVLSWSDGEHRCLGYGIGREFWGRGIASAAVQDYLQLERERPLRAHVAKHNLGSLRVLEKVGFAICGEGVISALRAGADEPVQEWLLALE